MLTNVLLRNCLSSQDDLMSIWMGKNKNSKSLTPSLPPRTSPYCTYRTIYVASMAAAQDMEHQQVSLNLCVDVLWSMRSLMVTHCSSPDPSASQNAGRRCFNPFFCVAILAQGPSFDSAQIPESQGSTSPLLRVEVTSMCFGRNSLGPS